VSSQQWTFSGEDRGEAGTFRASSNSSACLDVAIGAKTRGVWLLACVSGKASQKWKWDSSTGHLSSAGKQPCIVKSRGAACAW